MTKTCPACGQRNEQGAQFCANPACGAYLGWEKQTHTGTLYGLPAARADGPEQDQRAGVRADLAEKTVQVKPGETASVTVSVQNTGTRVEGLQATVGGPAAAWTTVEPAELSVYPEQSTTVQLRFTPPRSVGTPAGSHGYTLRLASTINPGLAAIASGVAVVAPFHDLAAELVPPSASGRRITTQQIVLVNNGNIIERLQLAAADDEGALTVRVATPAVDLPPARIQVALRVQARPRWFGRSRSVPVRVTVTPAGVGRPPIRLEGTRHLVPLMPTWVPALAAILVLFGGGAAAAMNLASGPADPAITAAPPPAPTSKVARPTGPAKSVAPTPTSAAPTTPSTRPPESTAPPTTPPPTGKRPPPGAVAVDEGTYRFRPRHSFSLNKCLGIADASTQPAAWVIQTDCADAPDQQFAVRRVRSKVYWITPASSDLCISAGAVGRGTEMFQDTCDETRADQEFAFTPGDDTPDGRVLHLRPMHSYDTVPAGMCIGVGASSLENGGHVGQWDCLPALQDQDFYLIPQ